MVKFNLKKKVAKALVFAMVMGTVGVHGVGLRNPLKVVKADDTTTAPKDTVTAYNSDPNTLTYTTNDLTGNYVYVSYYTDEACTKLKSTAVYTAGELASTDGTIPLGNLNLKKGGFFKVYDEILGAEGVNAFEIDPQAAKIKVKVVDASKEKFFEALQITVGTEKVTAETLAKYQIEISAPGVTPTITDEDSANAAWASIKTAAKANGLTVQVVYKGETGKNGMASEAKLKVAAAPKAPKVTVDYVNGTYAIPKGVKYVVTSVGSTGAIVTPAPTAMAGAATTFAKESKTADELIKGLGASPAPEKAAVVMWSEKAKKMDSMQTVFIVEGLKKIGVDYGSDTTKAAGSLKLKASGDTEGIFTGDEVAKLTFTATGVTIEAKADMAYYTNGKWTTVKASKSTKEIAVAAGSKIKMKALGMKATKTEAGRFGSGEVEVTNEYVAAPVTGVAIGLAGGESKINPSAGVATFEKPDADETIKLAATVTGDNLTDNDKGVKWSVVVKTSVDDETTVDGVATIGETNGELTIKAGISVGNIVVVTVKSEKNPSKTDTLEITITAAE